MDVAERPVAASDDRDELIPLRGESFSAEHLELHFQRLAHRQVLMPRGWAGKDFSSRFERHAAGIISAHQRVIESLQAGHPIPAEAEWLLDNFYVVEEQLREIRDDLPRGFYRELPKTSSGYPRVYEFARDLIVHSDSSMDADLIERCTHSFQTLSPLSIGETWAVPIMLRLVLVENLHRLCNQMLLSLECRGCASQMVQDWKSQGRVHLQLCDHPHCIPTLIQLLEQLTDHGPEYRNAVAEVEHQVNQFGWQLPDVIRLEHGRQAANQVSIGNVITSMRLIANLDWIGFFERVNQAEGILREDPAGVYGDMHFESRDLYRHAVEEIAKRTQRTDSQVARIVVELSAGHAVLQRRQGKPCHVGYWLIDRGRDELEAATGFRRPMRRLLRHSILRFPHAFYFSGFLALTLIGVALLLWPLVSPPVAVSVLIVLGLLWLLPLSEVALGIVNLVVTNILTPRLLPRFEFKHGVPSRYPTVVVVPSMLSSNREVDSLLRRLESHYLSNSDQAILFALLTDFVDADTERLDEDEGLVKRASEGIHQLNERYRRNGHEPFYLFHRRRQWNSAEGKWMGWERKRGKLMEFGKLLRGEVETSYDVQVGNMTLLSRMRDPEATPFVITLDSDTQLPHEAARKLIGTLAHPLNRPQFDSDDQASTFDSSESRDWGTVKSGYTILQPRVSVQLESAGKSWFARLASGNPGVDPYVTATSDVYQDLFGEGSFTGKGIYDLQAFERALENAFPENSILSHDLIEGCHARVGLVSSIEFFDAYPARYETDARRTHRWVRGDWQLLPWLLPRVPYASGWKRNPLSWLSWWKVADNLRRSLVAPALVLALIGSWLLVPQLAGMWTLLGLVVLLFPVMAQLSVAVIRWPWKLNFIEHARTVCQDVALTLGQCLLAIAVLPHKAVSMVDAILRTLWRLMVSRQQLLEWETAAAVEQRVSNRRNPVQQFWWITAGAIVVAALLPWPAALTSLPFLSLWAAAPLLIHWVNQPFRAERTTVNDDQRAWLSQLVSETWSFFEAYVGPADHWLPVDNVQEEPHEKIAHRLSPTNEGLYLVSALIARKFGYISMEQLAELLENNLDGVDRLEKLNGHIYNWYDTQTLQPLNPRYVSTVDSGNLMACLLTLPAGIQDIMNQPWDAAHFAHGIVSSLSLVSDVCQQVTKDDPAELRRYAEQLQEQLQSMAICATATTSSGEVEATVTSLRRLLQWLHANSFEYAPKRSSNAHYQRLRQKTSLVRKRLQGLLDEYDRLFADRPGCSLKFLEGSSSPARALINRLTAVARRAEALALGMDFKFLYNAQRRLFSIGFNVDEGILDRSHYDLLCSESRLASYLAIAKGDVEATHWFRLGRHATITEGQFALLSWGGTMFEYLMPPLFQRQYEGSMLTQSCHAALRKQQRYGRQHRVPWGISESAFGALAVNADYHYRSFGVPGLGLKRGLAKDLVISPYSTMMALTLDPKAAFSNLQHLQAEGAHGHWGFYEALDYTADRLPVGKRRLIVRCYMAHHHGMSLLALANLLHGEAIQRWFNAHPLARAAELLLQERIPRAITPYEPHADESDALPAAPAEQQLTSRRLLGVESPSPRTHLLSNGSYHIMLSSAGGGYSRCEQMDVTRWRSDTTLDPWGQFIYLREAQSQQVWSATYQPTCVNPDKYEVIFSIDKVDFHRLQGGIETLLEVAISPENNTEVRQLRLTNHTDQPRSIEVTSFAEIALARSAADLAHPAFQKLFLETEYIADETAILVRRRPRDSAQEADWAVHVLAASFESGNQAGGSQTGGVGNSVTNIQYETSRQAFLGRRGSTRAPQALQTEGLSGQTGAVLDPIFSLRCTVHVEPGASVTVAWSTGVAKSRQEALVLADQYHEPRNVQRVFELAWAFAQVELRHQHLTPDQVHLYQKLATYLLYPHRSLRGNLQLIAQNRLGQSGLWRHGISGDLPILVVHVTEPEQTGFVRELALAHRFWKERGFATDVVIINDYPGSYYDALQDQIIALLRDIFHSPDHPGVYLLRGAQLGSDDLALLEAVAACALHGDQGTIAQQIDAAQERAQQLAMINQTPAKVSRRFAPDAPSSTATIDHLEYWNGTGGFAQDGREYHIRLDNRRLPPMPWSHVIANARFGFLVTESGGGYSWFENSRENKLTTWSNDPISDSPSEVLYVLDEQTGSVHMPMHVSHASSTAEAWARYGAGFAEFEKHDAEWHQQTLLSVATDDPVKFMRLRLTNRNAAVKTVVVTLYAEMVLGVTREQSHWHLQTEFDESSQSLLIRNPYHPEFGSQVAFVRHLGEVFSYTADRAEFLGRNGSWEQAPGAGSVGLNRRTGVGWDPCAAVQARAELQPGETREFVFVLGAGRDEAEARELVVRYTDSANAFQEIARNLAQWRDTLSKVQVQTPNRALDLLVNNWLIYQVLCCRVWGRSAFYQSGGAYGFRDQLQDCMALVYCRPDVVRTHILRAASRQFRQGDVQHWWHPPLGKGTRTRFSDDLLWLPFVVCHYVQTTGDESILEEVVSFLDSPELQEGEIERYEQPRVSDESATLYEHCLRAIDRGRRLGVHGLPLMGCGDWNDGMNKVGEGGKGESVWVGWFLLVLLDKFLPLMQHRGDHDKAEVLREFSERLRQSIETEAWDGQWYRRAYFDDGTPLGSAQNDDCQIDSLTQSWAVFAKAPPERVQAAMHAAVTRLVRKDTGIILLFTPPFDHGKMDPGYIKGYLPGIRENGGQYTHAATWVVQALAEMGDASGAHELLTMINPIQHAVTAEDVARYQTEPYVVAADVYGIHPHEGRGGWTWYTGSAAWLYRVIVESLLGLKVQAGESQLDPAVPSDWEGYEVRVGDKVMKWHR